MGDLNKFKKALSPSSRLYGLPMQACQPSKPRKKRKEQKENII